MNASATQHPPQNLEQDQWRPILARRLMRTLFFIMIPATLAASYYAIVEGEFVAM